MEPSPIAEGTARLDDAAGAVSDPGYGLNIVMVCEDALNKQWAVEVRERVAQVAGPQAVQCHAWELGELSEPEALKQAVSHTAEADVIVVSIQAAGGLPRELQGWIDAWLPQRLQTSGVLVALIGRPDGRQAERVRQDLYSVARKAGLDFLVEERARPPAAGPACSALSTTTPSGPTEVVYPVFGPNPSSPTMRHWGINE